MLWDLNANNQDQNPLSQQVSDLLMELGLVNLHHHLGTMEDQDHENVVSGAARQIIVNNMCLHLWNR